MPTSLAAAAAEPATDASATWRNTVGGVDVVFGAGAVRRLGELVRELGGRRVLVVTDPGVRRGCEVDGVVATLGDDIAAAVFDGVRENPTTEHVEAGVAVARDHEADLLVGFGGGSAMDCAKGINFLVTNGGRMEDYRGVDKARALMLPSIGVPTTAGTGSEAQRFALISHPDTHEKMACGDPGARFRSVVLDPELTRSAPARVTVATGADAITHAVESYVTRVRTPISRMHAREAWALLSAAFPRVLEDPDDLAARGRMQVGAHLAGAAIECSMLGAAHACANPLTAAHDVTHGIAVALMLPSVVRHNADDVGDLYGELFDLCIGQSTGPGGPEHRASRPERDEPEAGREATGRTAAGEALARALEDLWNRAGLPGGLAAVGIERDELEGLARRAADEWTAGFNPRPVDEEALLSIYESAWPGEAASDAARPAGAAPEAV